MIMLMLTKSSSKGPGTKLRNVKLLNTHPTLLFCHGHVLIFYSRTRYVCSCVHIINGGWNHSTYVMAKGGARSSL